MEEVDELVPHPDNNGVLDLTHRAWVLLDSVIWTMWVLRRWIDPVICFMTLDKPTQSFSMCCSVIKIRQQNINSPPLLRFFSAACRVFEIHREAGNESWYSWTSHSTTSTIFPQSLGTSRYSSERYRQTQVKRAILCCCPISIHFLGCLIK